MLLRAILIAGVIALTVAQSLYADARLELLGKPCRAKNVLAGLVVTDRTDGRERVVLTSSNEESNLEMLYLDVEKNTCEVFPAPAGQGSWNIMEVPGDRLVITTHFHAEYLVFDLRAKKFIAYAGVPGEEYVYDGVIMGDGRLYAGTYPGGKLTSLDLETYKVEDLGAPAPPNMYCRGLRALDSHRLLCSLGIEKPTTMMYDITTRQFSPAPTEPEQPAPPQSAQPFMPNVDLRGGRVLVHLKDGSAVGIRGQQYFRMRPGDKELKLLPIRCEGGARPLQFLRADPLGRLWGGPEFGQTLCSLDTRTGAIRNTDVVCDGGGEIFDAAFYGGKMFTASYSGGDITRFAPDRPWDQWNNKNPKTIAQLGPRGYIRPIAGMVVGPGNKLYSGWMANYGVYGGAVAITNPMTGETDLIENPLGEQVLRGIAAGENAIYIGSGLQANGMPDKTSESARFGVIETPSKQVVFSREFEGASMVRNLVYDAKTKRVFVSVSGSVYVFDCQAKRFINEKPIDAPRVWSRNAAGDGEGHVYYSDKMRVIRFDMFSLKAKAIATAPAPIKLLEVGPDKTVYVGCGASVYVLRENEAGASKCPMHQ